MQTVDLRLLKARKVLQCLEISKTVVSDRSVSADRMRAVSFGGFFFIFVFPFSFRCLSVNQR